MLPAALLLAALPAGAVAAPGLSARRASLRDEIRVWRADQLPPAPSPLNARFSPRLDAVASAVAAARDARSLARAGEELKTWERELLAASYGGVRPAASAVRTRWDPRADLKQRAALDAARRAFAGGAGSAAAAADGSALFDGGSARGEAVPVAPADSGAAVTVEPPPLAPDDPARYAKVRAIVISEGASPRIVDAVIKAAISQKADPLMVLAVINQESDFDPRAHSSVGARGLMQLMPATARRFGVKKAANLYQVQPNLHAGIAYLKELWTRFTGGDMSGLASLDLRHSPDVRSAVAAYNAGPHAVDKYGGVPPYRETEGFVKKVLGYYERLKSALGS